MKKGVFPDRALLSLPSKDQTLLCPAVAPLAFGQGAFAHYLQFVQHKSRRKVYPVKYRKPFSPKVVHDEIQTKTGSVYVWPQGYG